MNKFVKSLFFVAAISMGAQEALAASEKFLYMLIPTSKSEWMASMPMISMDGGLSGKAMTADPDRCGWFYYRFAEDEAISDDVVFFRSDDDAREDMIGMNGDWEVSDKAVAIPLSMLFSTSETLYFVPEESLKDEYSDGWYVEDPQIDGICEYSLAAVIYDTDASLHGAFACKPDWSMGQTENEANGNACRYASAPYQAADSGKAFPCVGVTQGMVTEFLNTDRLGGNYKKPILTEKGKKCFGSQADAAFAAMFNSTAGINETYCVDIPFSRAKDGKWEFDSDNYLSPGATVAGGFYPAETTPSYVRMMSAYLPAAETKRKAEGPLFLCEGLRAVDPVEGTSYADLLCNGPGWNGGESCEGLFAGGSEFDGTFNGVSFTGDGWGWSCPNEAPEGWTFYASGSETKIGVMENRMLPAGESRWTSGQSDSQPLNVGGRNQHFCFESHAQFTYRKGLRFSFRGNDDIWVYVDNRLAVDIGGIHLDAPGYVDLDQFNGASGPLIEGNKYDLDVFFCDRRTTTSKVQIKTNMYMGQKTASTITYTKGNSRSTTEYNMCYSQVGDGSCGALLFDSDGARECCGSEIGTECKAQISYVLVKGRNYANGAATYDPYNIEGIDLSDPYNPKIDKKRVRLPAGLWTLFVVINDNYKPLETFRSAGGVEVVYGDAVAVRFNDSDDEIGRTSYSYVESAMAVFGNPSEKDMIPVYVSALAGTENGKLIMIPDDAAGSSYSLDIPANLNVYHRNEQGGFSPVSSDDLITIGPSGVDTVFVFASSFSMLSEKETIRLGVMGGTAEAELTFFLPKLSFVDSKGDVISGSVPHENQYDELWVGSYYDFNLVALVPKDDGSYALCSDCNFDIALSEKSSPGIEAKGSSGWKIKNGRAKISVRSHQEYRYTGVAEGFGYFSVVADNPLVSATYAPVYFRNPLVPFVGFADIFDVRGKAPSDLVMNGTYVAEEYLDGIADSIAIYFDRRIHKDSLPSLVCVLWDSSSAEAINPVKMGVSNKTDDTHQLCNAVLTSEIKCLNMDSKKYCDPIILAGGLKLSEDVKTSGSGKVITYQTFLDQKKLVMQGFASPIVDRIAPVLMLAGVDSLSKGYERLTLVVSEPVNLQNMTNRKAFDYFLQATSELSSAAITSVAVPSISVDAYGQGKIDVVYATQSGKKYPRAYDYVRLGGDLNNVMWTDISDYADYGQLRYAADAYYQWNSPTGYAEVNRLPSPWVKILSVDDSAFVNYLNKENDAKDDNKIGGYAKPKFRVRMVDAFTFEIYRVEDDSPTTVRRNFAVYDLSGSVVNRGVINPAGTVITVPSRGTYIVRSGHHSELVTAR